MTSANPFADSMVEGAAALTALGEAALAKTKLQEAIFWAEQAQKEGGA